MLQNVLSPFSSPSNGKASPEGTCLGRVLLVSHNFPPTLGPESTLVKLNTLDLLQRGWQLSVVTTTMEHYSQEIDPELLDGLPKTLEVIRTPSYDAVTRKRWPYLGTKLLQLLNLVLPEVFLLWSLSAIPAGKRWLRQHPDAVIYSRATKHVSNVTAWFLKRATGRPWIAHFSDPWQMFYLNPLQARIARWFERRIFRDADAIVVVNAALAKTFEVTHPRACGKIHVIPHGYAPLERDCVGSKEAGLRAMEVIQAGSFIPTMREPDNLFAGLALLNSRLPLRGRLHLTCVGADTTQYKAKVDALGLTGIVMLLAAVPYQKCQEMVASSDLLLVLDTPNSGGIFLPTKLIEYLPYAKPVLGLTEPGSTVHEVLQNCDLDYADQNDPEAIASAFEQMLMRWQSGNWGVSLLNLERVQSYRIDKVNEPLHLLLKHLSKHRDM